MANTEDIYEVIWKVWKKIMKNRENMEETLVEWGRDSGNTEEREDE